MIFHLCLYYQLWVKWVCIHIGNSSGHIRLTHSRFSKYLWMFNTERHAHKIYILNSSTRREKTALYIAHLIILCTSTETSIYWKFKDKIFKLFEAPNQHNCCDTVLWKFLQVLISVLGKWSI